MDLQTLFYNFEIGKAVHRLSGQILALPLIYRGIHSDLHLVMYVFSPILLHTLQLVGLWPVSLARLPLRGEIARHSNLWLFYSAFLMVVIAVVLCGWVYELFFNTEVPEQRRYTTTTSLIMAVSSALSTFLGALVCLSVALLRSSKKILLLERLREIDFQLHRNAPSHNTRVVSYLALVYCCIMVIYDVIEHFNYISIYAISVAFKIVLICGLVELMELVLSVKDRFQLINQRVEELVMRSRTKQLLWTVTLPCVEAFSNPRVMSLTIPGLSETHWSLCCIVYDINVVYGCQMVALMVFIFAHLVFYPYFLFLLFSMDYNKFLYAILIGNWILLYVGELYFLVWPCAQAVAELENFAQQLFHRDVEFSACGLFNLHTSIIVSVASAVTTYLAIIIQFQTSSVGENSTSITTDVSVKVS
ncbi:putative gustatory receptor 28b [Homalodisca vitripennis]|uniref:putative gustatory receptor 28b n=1 Tax=Homalodisca vitripennis TaxID=197043 RepID=UPI001EEB0601|nr:putative gustatory receptor 28b [Homalodisca vitripennis]